MEGAVRFFFGGGGFNYHHFQGLNYLRFQDAGWKKFSEAQLRTVLNVCGVQSTSTWTKEELVPGPFVFFLDDFF